MADRDARDDDEREIAERLRRVRTDVPDPGESDPVSVRGDDLVMRAPLLPDPVPSPEPEPSPQRPELDAVNDAWRTADVDAGGGIRARLGRLLRSALAPWLDAQERFNARQVQLDNALVAYVEARLQRTHRHYDHILGLYGRHLGEADERHVILQEELVSHVHDLVRRIDLVLAHAEREQLGLRHELRDIKARLERIETTLGRR